MEQSAVMRSPEGMAADPNEVDAAMSRILTKGTKKKVSVDGLTSETEGPGVDDLLKLEGQAAARDTTKLPFRYGRFLNTSRGS